MRTRRIAIIIGVLLLSLSWVLVNCGPAGEVKPVDFYRGKSIDFTYVGTAGDYGDLAARAAAPHLSAYTGAVAVVTDRRGAAGTEGVVWVYNAKPDGLTLGNWLSLPLAMNKINEAPGADYQLENFPYLMGIGKEPMAFFVSAARSYTSLAALKAGKNLKIAGTSARGNISIGGMSVAHLLDLDAKVVTGYKGPEGALLSVAQGETVGSNLPITAGLVGTKAGQIKPLFVLSTERFSAWPDVPALTELVTLTGEKKDEIEKWRGLSNIMVFYSSPGVPKDRASFLREIFDKIMAKPEFRSDVDKIHGYQVKDYFTGQEVSKMMGDLAKGADSYRAIFARLVEQYAAMK